MESMTYLYLCTKATNGCGKSDRPIVAEKPSNKDWGVPHSAEEVERRGLTKGNPLRQIRSRTQRRAGSEYGQP